MNNLISKQTAIDALIEWYGCEPSDIGAFKNIIEKLPSARPERPKGEWVGVHAYCDHLNEEAKVNGRTDRYFPSGIIIGVYCNQCWCRADKKSDFCPNCGADMRGERDDESRSNSNA